MLNPKYKISNMAKDLSIKGKEITDILENSGRGTKSTSAVLSAEDFDIILNELSLANQIKGFNDYMELKVTIPRKFAKEDPKKEETKAEEKKSELKAETEKEEKKPEPKPETKKEEKKPEPKPEPKKEVKAEVKAEAPVAPAVQASSNDGEIVAAIMAAIEAYRSANGAAAPGGFRVVSFKKRY